MIYLFLKDHNFTRCAVKKFINSSVSCYYRKYLDHEVASTERSEFTNIFKTIKDGG